MVVFQAQRLLERRARSAPSSPLPAAGGRGSLSTGSPGWILFCTPSRPAISIAAKARYALAVGSGSGPRRGGRSCPTRTMRHAAERLRRVGEVDRRASKPGTRRLAVGAGVGDRVQRLRVLDDAADVVQREVREPGVAVASEEVLAALPHRLVAVHPGAVIADDRLRHERRRLAVGGRRVPHRVLQDLHPVGALNERREARADLALSGRRHLVVVLRPRTPCCSSASTMALRMSPSVSIGGTGNSRP